jgi:hypothetical protein
MKLSDKKHKEYLYKLITLISNTPYANDFISSKFDSISDEGFRRYLFEPRFGMLDSVRISLYGDSQGRHSMALAETLAYFPTIIAFTTCNSVASTIVYSVNKIKLDYIEFHMNYKALDGGYKHFVNGPIEKNEGGYLGPANFYSNAGKMMPMSTKLVDLMTVYSISGRSKPETTYAYFNYTVPN